MLSGAALAAAFPAPALSALAWVALVPLFAVVLRAPPTLAAASGLAHGLVFQSALGIWLLDAGVHPAAYALGALGCAAFPAAFAAAGAWLAARAPAWSALSLPALWVLSEYARAHFGFGAAPWGLLGYTQVEVAPVARIAGVAGVFGVSFALAGANAAFAWAIARRRGRTPGGVGLALACAAALALACAGAWSASGAGEPTLRVAVLQGGSSDGLAPDSNPAVHLIERYEELTRAAAARGAVLVVWPESSLPAPLPDDREALSNLARLARGLRIHLLVSTAGRDKRAPAGARRRANSVFLFGPDGRIAGRYDKVRLLPFIEYLPLRGWIPWPSWIAPAMEDAAAGDSPGVFAVEGARFAVQLCWENLFPGALPSPDADSLDFVVSMTNEAFTGSAAGRRQLYAINAMRALENGAPLLRAATTGVSALLDARGREIARVRDADGRDLDAVGLALADVALGSKGSFYARRGDWWVALAALVSAGAGLAAWRSRLQGAR